MKYLLDLFLRRPWVCQQSLRQNAILRRSYTVLAATPKAVSGTRPSRGKEHSSSVIPDDHILRNIFDSSLFWREFSQHTVTHRSAPSRGLFQNQYLTSPDGFEIFTQVTLQRCRGIVTKALEAQSFEELRSLPKDLDRLSDSICRVIDLAEFVRNTHPEIAFQDAATKAYTELFEYMNILNTTPGLNDALQRAVSSKDVTAIWSEEERTVAEMLLKDFSRSAIDMPAEKRQQFVNLSSSISQLGTAFVDKMQPARPDLHLDSRRLKGMDPGIIQQITNRWGRTSFPTTGAAMVLGLRTITDDVTRRNIYIAGRQASQVQIDTLETFLKSRNELAKLSGFESYAHLILADKMAKSPEAVKLFLTALAADNKPQRTKELEEMLRLKDSIANTSLGTNPMNAWDEEFYRTRLATALRSKSRRPDFLAAYFSLGTVMQGLSRLFSRLYGVRLVPREPLPGETWNPDVRRLDVFDDTEGRIAVVYCDLFSRQGKNPNPAHFTLRCSRRISSAEVSEAAALSPLSASLEATQAANDGMTTSISANGDLYQLPTIALICDFQAPADPTHPTLLSFRDVRTLFHEMGHAIHSVLGRTNLHVVSGTRCATDFAELPSILMEHFAADPAVLTLFARHWETDAPLPYDMIAEVLAIERKGQGAETETQILMAMLDQTYHSHLPLRAGAGFDSTKIFHDVWNRYSSVKEPPETTWQGFFGHLVGYGGVYYSYLFDRAIAGRIWSEVFNSGRAEGAISRERGQKFRDQVLRWGGGRDGWSCVAGVLGDEKVKDGGPEAMKEVGKWGLKD